MIALADCNLAFIGAGRPVSRAALSGWKRNLLLGGLLLLFFIAAVLVALLPEDRQLPSVVLGDGRLLQVAEVTVGTNHVYSSESKLKEFLRGILPSGLAAKLGPSGIVATRDSEREMLVVWLGLEPQTGMKIANYRPSLGRTKVRSDDGETFESWTWLRTEVDRERILVPIMVQVYPRRASAFGLEGKVDGHDFKLRIRNPNPFAANVSALPSDLPITNTAGAVNVVLRSGSITNYAWGPGPVMEFEFWDAGLDKTDEFGRWWLISDVTGNRDWRVPTNEPIWMVDTYYYRVAPTGWPADRLHELSVTNSFAAMDHTERELVGDVGRTELRKIWLGGAGTYIWQEGELVHATEPPADGKNKPYHGSRTPDNKSQLEWARAEPWAMIDAGEYDGTKHYLSVFLIDRRGVFSVGERFTHLQYDDMDATIFSFPDLKDGTKKLIPPIKVQLVLQDLGKAMFTINPAELPRAFAPEKAE